MVRTRHTNSVLPSVLSVFIHSLRCFRAYLCVLFVSGDSNLFETESFKVINSEL